jgi:hypothetical protein
VQESREEFEFARRKGSDVKRYVVALRPDAEDAPRVEIEAASLHEAEAKVAARWHPDEVFWVVERFEPVEERAE